MRKMRKTTIPIVAILCCISFVGLVSCKDKEYNYTFEEKNNITNEQVKEIKSRIDKIYEYFDHKGYELDEVKFITANNTRADHPKDEIIIDFENISDFELMQLILQHEFSEYLNYGLMYGVMYDVSKTYELEFDEVTPYSIQEVEEYWDYMFLTYINFRPDIASETEVKISKYVAAELVKYIIDEHGSEYLFDLMKSSSDPLYANKVSEILDEWMVNNNTDFTASRIENREVFNQNSKDDTIEFITKNINWVLHLNNEEMYSSLIPSIHDSTQVFYDYMNILYEEILRLEGVLAFDSSKLPTATIEIYSDREDVGGVYYKHADRIQLVTLPAFSHEYIHFVDDCFNRRSKYRALGEMRAEYYSIGFQLLNPMFTKMLENYKSGIEDGIQKGLILTDPFDKVEKHLGRELTPNDFHLFVDVIINSVIESGAEMPSFFDVSSGGYPSEYWISMMNFLIRTYGDKAVDTIMFEEKLPDGTMKNITDVIQEWKIYITNLSEEDYSNYSN